MQKLKPQSFSLFPAPHADVCRASGELHCPWDKRVSLDKRRKCRNRDREKKTDRMALVDRIPVGQSGGKKIFSVSMAAMVTLLPECSKKCGGKMVMVAG